MNQKGQQNLFSGAELDKLREFCKNCAEEDKKLYEKRKSQTYTYNLGIEEKPKPQPQLQKRVSYNPPPSFNNNKQESQPYDYKNLVQYNTLNENDPDPLHARMKFDTFDERLKQFGGAKK